MALWNEVKDEGSIDDIGRYMERYPRGRFTGEAKDRLANLKKRKATQDVDFGTYHALVIGNNDYTYLPRLTTAVADAKVVATSLREDYGFNVNLLTNATRHQIIEALDAFVDNLEEKDNLLIYYAGHGWLNEDARRGYWQPIDARPNRRSKWVSNATLTDTLKTLVAKHVMIITDSCYSGTLTRSGGVEKKRRTADYWQRMAVKRARVALTSGGLEPVADKGGGENSPFAKALLDALSGNDLVMDATQLFTQMRRPVMVNAEQTPQYADVRNAGHDGGDFLFVRRQ